MRHGEIESGQTHRGQRHPAASRATFCPCCPELGDSSSADLCAFCGSRRVDRGYCPTCEDLWDLRVGDLCPKHDVVLEIAPDPLDPTLPQLAPGDHWVTVATFNHPNEANGPRIRLEAEGVPTFLDGERIAVSTPYQDATGGARLQVPASLLSTARVLLDQRWDAPAPPNGFGPDDDLDDEDDPWAGLGPDPGTRRRGVMKVAIVIFLIGPLLIWLLGFLDQVLPLRF